MSSELTLVLGNKNYSSWSLRAWLAARATGLEFGERTIWLDEPDAAPQKRALGAANRVPVLLHGGLTIWDSLAIVEYLHELCPDAGLWPSDRPARARARSICAEMHSGFHNLRSDLPMNCRARKEARRLSDATEAEVARVQKIWIDTTAEFGGDDGFLFGSFGAADAFFAPVVSRLVTYGVPVTGIAAEYMDKVLEHPPMQEWLAAAEQETHALAKYDRI